MAGTCPRTVCIPRAKRFGWWRISVANDSGKIPCALIVMGVSGAGKSTIGEKLAERLGWKYEDGDRFHPASNVAKMSAGQPLTDEDRWPWLRAIADEIERICAAAEHVVIASSALKRAYRDILVHGRSDVRIIFLDGPQELIASRLALRKSHFMPPGASENPVTVSIDASVETIVNDILRQLMLSPADSGAFRRTHS